MSEADSLPIPISFRRSWEARVAKQTACSILGYDRDSILLGKLMAGGPDLKPQSREASLKEVVSK